MNALLSTGSRAELQDCDDPTPIGTGLLRGVTLVWLAYTLTLALIDTLLLPDVMPTSMFYVAHVCGAIALLAFVSLLGQRFRSFDVLSLCIGWIVAMTILAALPSAAGRLQSGVEGLALRDLPVLMLALVLVAWRYRWPQMIAFSVGTALVSCAPLLLIDPATFPAMGPTVVVAAIQTTSFLAVGGAVSLLIQHVRSQQAALEQANRQLRLFADMREQLGASQERSRIARELHDTLAHTLSGLSIQLEGADACWDHDLPRARTIIQQSQTVVRSGLQETRRALRALRAGPIEQYGLRTALSQLASTTAARANLRLELALAHDLPPLPEAIEQCVYRVAQESLTNVIRHAGARSLRVQFHAYQDNVELLVCDDGRGLGEPMARADHYGLRGLRERTEDLGGELAIESIPGGGVTVRLTIPYR